MRPQQPPNAIPTAENRDGHHSPRQPSVLFRGSLGRIERSPYHNVLVMAVENPVDLLDAIERRSVDDPALYDAISRVARASCCFDFETTQ